MDVLVKKMDTVTCSGEIAKCMQGSLDQWAGAQVYVTRATQEKCMSKSKGKSALVFAACWIAEQYKTLVGQKENLEEKLVNLNDVVDSLTFSAENAAAMSISNQQTMAENQKVGKENEQLKQRLREAEGTIKSLVSTSSNVGADNSKCIPEIKGLKAQLGARSPVLSALIRQTNTNKQRDLSANSIKESCRKCETASEGNVASIECTSHARPSKVIINCAEYRADKLKQNSTEKQGCLPLQPRKQHGNERVSAVRASHPQMHANSSTLSLTYKKHTEKKLFRCYACSRVGHTARHCAMQYNYSNNNTWYKERENWNFSRWAFQKQNKSWNTWVPYKVLKIQNERLSEENFSLKNAWGKCKEISQMKRTKTSENRGLMRGDYCQHLNLC
uniref:CCHC-type domain-containing protein n=1 Tax=Xenopus tropicalis TaxID=8364 RepID=A0A803JAF8_XENTR